MEAIRLPDSLTYGEYADSLGRFVVRYLPPGRYLVRGATPTVPEGDWPSGARAVVVEFPSMEQVRRWYESSEYAAALRVRRTALHRRLLFVEGAAAAADGLDEQS